MKQISNPSATRKQMMKNKQSQKDPWASSGIKESKKEY
jgi:hypothetical protein